MAVHKWIEIFLPSAMAAVPRYRVNLVLFSPPGGVTILPIRLENIGADSLEIDPASHYHSMMEEPADQTNKQQSPTNVATVSCSYAKIIAKLEAMSHENSIRIRMKLGDLTSDWTSATAVKKEGYFECSMDNSELDPVALPFEDETKSLLSLDLWKCGWYSLPDEVDQNPERDARLSVQFEFKGRKSMPFSLDGQSYTLFPSCTIDRDGCSYILNPKSAVLNRMEDGFVYFMAAKAQTPKFEHKAVVYNCTTCSPEVVSLLNLSLDVGKECSGRVLQLDATTLDNMSESIKKFLSPTTALDTKIPGDDGSEVKSKAIREAFFGHKQTDAPQSHHSVPRPSGSTKQKRLPKIADPYSPEDVRHYSKKKKQKSAKQSLLQQPSDASKLSKTSKQKLCSKPASVVDTEKLELCKRIEVLEKELQEAKSAKSAMLKEHVPTMPMVSTVDALASGFPATLAIANEQFMPRPNDSSIDRPEIKAMKMMLAAQHMTTMAHFFSKI